MEPATDAAPTVTSEASGSAQPAIRVCCWGTRGSIPAPGPATAQYGGNTPCLEVRLGDELVILDAGTGIRALGTSLLAEQDAPRASIFLTHFHWDHIQGFPFFMPLYNPASSLRIMGPKQLDVDIQTLFAGQMGPIYFPIPYEAISAQTVFGHLNEGTWEEGDICISAMRVRHPSFTVGYRIERAGKSLVYIPDNELEGDDPQGLVDCRQELVNFVGDADVLIHDSMYTDEEYQAKAGWGHSTFRQALELADEGGVKRLLFFHHSPDREDAELSEILSDRREMALSRGFGFDIEAASEGNEILI
ncbi:MAG: MBL fold metallo-hydrolase [Gemmatimonadetes bacterium]|nr:MBL fold metallo-hydrolase [Gemmatimonadota bacterium]